MTTTVWDVTRKLQAEVLKEIEAIGNGQCLVPEGDAVSIALGYKERLGFVSGLRRALTVIEEMERDGA